MSNEELPTNWGRWGEDDQLGTLHLIDPAATARAAAEVVDGRHVSLARAIDPVGLTTGLAPIGQPAVMPAGVLQVMNFNGVTPVAITDTVMINTHNAAVTHLDAVAHMPVDNHVYPGVPLGQAVTPVGVSHGSADAFGAGILTRGVLVDLAPDGARIEAERRIGAADLDAALEREDTQFHPGDALVLRAGWDPNQALGQPLPGLDLSAVRWMDEHGVSVYVGDIGDARPPELPLPVHQVALARLGLPLVDAAGVDELAEVCASLSRWSFMLVLAPPRINRSTGLIVNPIPVF